MKTRKEMIQDLLDDDIQRIENGSMKDNDEFIYDALLNGRKGYNNYSDKELQEEYNLYLESLAEDEEEEEA